MGVMAVGLFITIFLLFHRISSSKLVRKGFSMILDFSSRDEGSSSIDTVHPINLRSKTQQELVEARGKICELGERPTKIGADLKAEIDSKVAEMSRTISTKMDQIEADLMGKITKLEADLQSERENKTAEIAKLQEDLNRTMIHLDLLDLEGWSYLPKTASWYKASVHQKTFDEAEAYCASRKGHLVSIHSQEENDFVEKIAKNVGSDWWFWNGLKRNPNKENAFEWTDGSSVDFTNWRVGEPDSNTQARLRSHDGKWLAYPYTNEDHNQDYFICKRSFQF